MTASVPSATAVDDIADDQEVDDTVKKRLGFGFWIAISWIGLVSIAALFAPLLPIADPNEIANGAPRDGILGDNFMGTDALGRDVFARTIWGARISLGVGFLGILLGSSSVVPSGSPPGTSRASPIRSSVLGVQSPVVPIPRARPALLPPRSIVVS